MGVTCEIFIPQQSRVFLPGEVVAGSVRYAIDEKTKYKDIVLSLNGKGKCHWTESRRVGKNTVITRYIGTEDIFTQKVNLLKGNDEEKTLPPGVYEHSYQFVLPSNIPSSFKDSHSSVKYFIQMKFKNASFFSFNKQFTTEVYVSGYALPVGPEGSVVCGLEKKLFNLFSSEKTISLKTEISKTLVSAGENIDITYNVVNNTKCSIPTINTKLVCHMTYTANCGRTKKRSYTVDSCKASTPTIHERSVTELRNIIKTLPDLFSIQQSKVVEKAFALKIIMVLPSPHFNAVVETPVAIGVSVRQGDEFSLVQEEQAPPSYWEVMNEDKVKEEDNKDEI